MIEKNWQELKKPENKTVKSDDDYPNKATIIVEPFERGFGVTVGNALRRVLLSSLQGAAITSIQIQGVLHEFSSVPGVREDVTDMVLNLKGVAVKMSVEGPKRVRLAAQGPCSVTAGMIAEVNGVEIMNPDHVICTLDDGAELNAELTVETGSGYVPASANRNEDSPIGLISIDAIYSPIRQVAYKVENTRVGQRTDFDKLLLIPQQQHTQPPPPLITLHFCC